MQLLYDSYTDPNGKFKMTPMEAFEKLEEFMERRVKDGRLSRAAADKHLRDIITTWKKGFDDWFDKLSADDVEKLFETDIWKKKMLTALRGPGKLHEYLMVSFAPYWKRWGVTMAEFRKYAEAIADLDKKAKFKHGGKFSTTAHNELAAKIMDAKSFADFKIKLRDWADKWLKGGVKDLPIGLQ